jgi:hypothetical protein
MFNGKAMAGLIDFIRKGLIGKDEQLLFFIREDFTVFLPIRENYYYSEK